jgi:hypothetical protein
MGHIQIRNVPPELHRKLKAKAAERGLSLSEYLLRAAEREAQTLTGAEILERIRARGGGGVPGVDSAKIIREEREAREEELFRRVTRRR